MKVAELRQQLAEIGLSTEGLKPELVDRLFSALSARFPDVAEPNRGTTPAAADGPRSAERSQENSPAEVALDSPARDVPDEAGDVPEDEPAQFRPRWRQQPVDKWMPPGLSIPEDDGNGTGLELLFLGTSSGSPTIRRNVTSIALRLPQSVWLVDCGEATQHRMLRTLLRPGKVARLFVTHLHGDHVFGIPGLLCSISNSRAATANEPVFLYGPPGLGELILTCLKISQTQLSMPVYIYELHLVATLAQPVALDRYSRVFLGHIGADQSSGRGSPTRGGASSPGRGPSARDSSPSPRSTTRPRSPSVGYGASSGGAGAGGGSSEGERLTWTLVEDDQGWGVTAGQLSHRVQCFGYVMKEADLVGRMQMDKVAEMGLAPGPLLKKLKDGISVVNPQGVVVHSHQVLGPTRRGRKLVVLGDTSNSVGIAELARDADVLVHEATFENELYDKALQAGHSTAGMAGTFAASINARSLILTHFSARYTFGKVEESSETPREGGEGMSWQDDDRTTAVLVRQAQTSMGSDNVIAARDYLRVGIRRLEEAVADSDVVAPEGTAVLQPRGSTGGDVQGGNMQATALTDAACGIGRPEGRALPATGARGAGLDASTQPQQRAPRARRLAPSLIQ